MSRGNRRARSRMVGPSRNKHSAVQHGFRADQIGRREKGQPSCTKDMAGSNPYQNELFPIHAFIEITCSALQQQHESIGRFALVRDYGFGGKPAGSQPPLESNRLSCCSKPRSSSLSGEISTARSPEAVVSLCDPMCPIAKLTAYYVHYLMLVFPMEYCQEGQSQNADGVNNTLSYFCGLCVCSRARYSIGMSVSLGSISYDWTTQKRARFSCRFLDQEGNDYGARLGTSS